SPSSAWISPAPSARSTPSSTARPPKRLTIPRNSRAGGGLIGARRARRSRLEFAARDRGAGRLDRGARRGRHLRAQRLVEHDAHLLLLHPEGARAAGEAPLLHLGRQGEEDLGNVADRARDDDVGRLGRLVAIAAEG